MTEKNKKAAMVCPPIAACDCECFPPPSLNNITTSDIMSSDVINVDYTIKNQQHELDKHWQNKKKNSLLLASSVKRIAWHIDKHKHSNRAERISSCGDFLVFRQPLGQPDERAKLYQANFCRDRLCPVCTWRKSLKIYGQMSKIMNYLQGEYCFLFLTLTVPNVPADELSACITKQLLAFNKGLLRNRRVKAAVSGWYRTLEITRNGTTGDYHPHIHIVLAVKPSYFKKGYIKQSEWLCLWRAAYGDERITQVDIRTFKHKRDSLVQGIDFQIEEAVCEAAKYAAKASDYIFEGNESLTDRIVSELSAALYHRRLVAYGGVFKEAHSLLNLDDAEEGDLVNTGNEQLRPDVKYMLFRWRWGVGAYNIEHISVDM